MTSSMDTPEPQAICNPITSSAIFIVATLLPGSDAASQVRGWCGDIAALTRSVGKRVPSGNLSCVCGFSANAWDALFGSPRPASLHPFREFGVEGRRAVATPGDILLHIRADQMDLCFELATQLCSALNGAITVVDEVQGFRYFDMRSIIGFVDGTENPVGRKADHFTLIGNEDPAFESGSYVLVQKYLHKMDAWNALSVEAQEKVIGRTKLADIELGEEVKPSNSHSALTTITKDGQEQKILRDNMPFGRPGLASSAPISLVTRVRRNRSSRCWRTCLSANPSATTTVCLTSAPQSPGDCSLCRQPTCSKSWPSESPRRRDTVAPRLPVTQCGARGMVFSRSSGLMWPTTLPGCGMLRMWPFILPMMCISHGLQSNFRVSTSSP